MGELLRRAHIAHGEDAGVGGAKSAVDGDARMIERHASLCQTKVCYVGHPSSGHQQLVARDDQPASVVAEDVQRRVAMLPRYALDASRQIENHPRGYERLVHNRRGLGVLPRENARRLIEYRHLTAEAGERLR